MKKKVLEIFWYVVEQNQSFRMSYWTFQKHLDNRVIFEEEQLTLEGQIIILAFYSPPNNVNFAYFFLSECRTYS